MITNKQVVVSSHIIQKDTGIPHKLEIITAKREKEDLEDLEYLNGPIYQFCIYRKNDKDEWVLNLNRVSTKMNTIIEKYLATMVTLVHGFEDPKFKLVSSKA